MGISDLLKRMFLGKTSEPVNTSPFMTRQELNDSIVENFRTGLQNETTKTGLLFPTCFYIYLNNDDFERRRQAFPNTVREVVMCFNDIIRQAKNKYPDFIPHSKRWTFQFASFSPGTIIDLPGQQITELPAKKAFILTSIYPESVSGYDNESSERMVMTIHDVKSSVLSQPVEVNRAAFRDVIIEARDRFVVEMGDFGNGDLRQMPKNESNNERKIPTCKTTPEGSQLGTGNDSAEVKVKQLNINARLRADNATFVSPRGPSQYFTVADELIYVCGRNSMNHINGTPTAKINNEEVLTPHLAIKCAGENEFYIAATGDVRLNEVLLPHDSNNWTRLPNNSSILINDEIQLTFKSKV